MQGQCLAFGIVWFSSCPGRYYRIFFELATRPTRRVTAHPLFQTLLVTGVFMVGSVVIEETDMHEGMMIAFQYLLIGFGFFWVLGLVAELAEVLDEWYPNSFSAAWVAAVGAAIAVGLMGYGFWMMAV